MCLKISECNISEVRVEVLVHEIVFLHQIRHDSDERDVEESARRERKHPRCCVSCEKKTKTGVQKVNVVTLIVLM